MRLAGATADKRAGERRGPNHGSPRSHPKPLGQRGPLPAPRPPPLLAGALAALAAFAGATPRPVQAAEPTQAQSASDYTLDLIRLQLRWQTQAQFMGYYVAQIKGLYEAEGLQVHIIPGGPGINTVGALRDGRADVLVEWFPSAMKLHEEGLPLLNVAQIFQRSSLGIACDNNAGIFRPSDLRGKTVAVWGNSTRTPFDLWMNSIGLEAGGMMSESDVRLIPQGAGVGLYKQKKAECISVTSYNEYWELIASGVPLSSITLFNFESNGFGLMEDGLYVLPSRLEDPPLPRTSRALPPRLHRRLARSGGQPDAGRLPHDPKSALTSSIHHQTRMANEVARLVGAPEDIGFLELDRVEHDLALMITPAIGEPSLEARPEGFWTHRFYDAATGKQAELFSAETKYLLGEVLSHRWFFILDIIGTIGFGLSGFLRARDRRYDIWGAMVLTSMPAVGGGTLRDLLVGGDRHPPFIFKDPIYMYIVAAIVIIGWLAASFARWPNFLRAQFERIFFYSDIVGMMAFTVIGANVAILAGLDWFWIPICSALSCAGGGVLMDVVTGTEPRTFRGEIYEEIAILGGLVMMLLLSLTDRIPHDLVNLYVTGSIVAVLAVIFAARVYVVRTGMRSPLLMLRRAMTLPPPQEPQEKDAKA